MRKTRVAVLVGILLAFGLMSLGSGSGSEKKSISTTEDKSSEISTESKADESKADEEKSDVETDAEETTNVVYEDSDDSTDSTDITIEEQVLVDDADIKVTAVEYTTDSIWGDGIKLLIENKGSKDIGVGCRALIVNDYMISDLFSATVAAGKKSNETMYLSSSELEAAGIENVGQVEMYLHTFNSDTYETIKDYDCMTVKTSSYDSMDTAPNDEGQELYNENGVRIVGKYVDENSFWGAAILLYIENNSGKNAIIQCDDLSVNGFMMSPLFSSNVYDGKKAIDDIALLSSELEENGITDINDIELKFKIIDEDYMNSVESDIIKFSAK